MSERLVRFLGKMEVLGDCRSVEGSLAELIGVTGDSVGELQKDLLEVDDLLEEAVDSEKRAGLARYQTRLRARLRLAEKFKESAVQYRRSLREFRQVDASEGGKLRSPKD